MQTYCTQSKREILCFFVHIRAFRIIKEIKVEMRFAHRGLQLKIWVTQINFKKSWQKLLDNKKTAHSNNSLLNIPLPMVAINRKYRLSISTNAPTPQPPVRLLFLSWLVSLNFSNILYSNYYLLNSNFAYNVTIWFDLAAMPPIIYHNESQNRLCYPIVSYARCWRSKGHFAHDWKMITIRYLA